MAVALVSGAICASAAGNDGTAAAAAPRHHWFQIGKASWYGQEFRGHRTADGEKFDPNGFTCAHRTLPLGSWIKVTNLLNRRSLFVRVTDRGPFTGSRIVDLSAMAAHRLGIGGLGKVQLEPVQADVVTSKNFSSDMLLSQMVVPAMPLITAR